jgi:hypothetical protein
MFSLIFSMYVRSSGAAPERHYPRLPPQSPLLNQADDPFEQEQTVRSLKFPSCYPENGCRYRREPRQPKARRSKHGSGRRVGVAQKPAVHAVSRLRPKSVCGPLQAGARHNLSVLNTRLTSSFLHSKSATVYAFAFSPSVQGVPL